MSAPVHAVEGCVSAAVQVAAQVNETRWSMDENGEQIGGDNVYREHLRRGIDAGVVDHGIHRAETIDLVGNAACLLEVFKISNDGHCAQIKQVLHGFKPVFRAYVNDDSMPVGKECSCRGPAESIGGTSDEYARHGMIPVCGVFRNCICLGGRRRRLLRRADYLLHVTSSVGVSSSNWRELVLEHKAIPMSKAFS